MMLAYFEETMEYVSALDLDSKRSVEAYMCTMALFLDLLERNEARLTKKWSTMVVEGAPSKGLYMTHVTHWYWGVWAPAFKAIAATKYGFKDFSIPPQPQLSLVQCKLLLQCMEEAKRVAESSIRGRDVVEDMALGCGRRTAQLQDRGDRKGFGILC